MVPSDEVGTPARPRKERVSHEGIAITHEHDTSLSVSRRLKDAQLGTPHAEHIALRELPVRCRGILDLGLRYVKDVRGELKRMLCALGIPH